MEAGSIVMKSLERFKENFRIHVLPFRFRDNDWEILLFKNEINQKFEDLSDFRLKMDVTGIFAAARILMKFLYNKDFSLDKNKENWNDILFRNMLRIASQSYENHISEDHQSFFIEESLWQENFEITPSFQWFSFSAIQAEKLNFSSNFLLYFSHFNIKAHLEYPNKKIYCLINCESASHWENIYEGLYGGHLQREHEIWTSLNVTKGEFPSEEDIKRISGWVVTGSHYATYDKNELWLDDLFKLLNNIVKIKGNNARILGICFGHQALAKAFGGQTEKMKNEFLLTKQKICFTEKFLEKDYVKNSKIPLEFLKEGVFLNQAHGDHVTVLPENADLFAFSDKTKIECFGIGDQILGIQPHPEFCDTFMIYKLLHLSKNEQAYRDNLLNGYTQLDVHNKEIMNICREFLNS